MNDPLVGTWKLNRDKSTFDANHRPSEGTMRLEASLGGGYLLSASGKNEKGDPVTERPQTFIPDGQPYPVDGMPGLSAITSRPDPRTLRAEVRREDGSVVGEGSYVVSADGASLVATTAGFDSQLRRFEMKTVWDREA
jgi:hypothetical protein